MEETAQARRDPLARPRILLVCTANICRSPAAQFLLLGGLGAAAESWIVESAGVSAVDGVPIDPVIASLLQQRGIATAGFRSRRLEVGMIASADLVLTASAGHRAAVARAFPPAVRKTFTLKQLARYAPFLDPGGDPAVPPAERVAQLLRTVPIARAKATERRRAGDDVTDPRGRSRRAYTAAVRDLERACAAVGALLGTGEMAVGGPQEAVQRAGGEVSTRPWPTETGQQPAFGRRVWRPSPNSRADSFFEWAFDGRR